MPMTVLFTLGTATLLSVLYGRSWRHFGAILLTCTVVLPENVVRPNVMRRDVRTRDAARRGSADQRCGPRPLAGIVAAGRLEPTA